LRHRRSQGDGPHRLEGHRLLRGRDDHCALFLGLALVNIFKPGAGLAMPIGADTSAAAAMAQKPAARVGHLPAPVPDLGRRCHGARRHPAARVFSTFFGIALAAIGSRGQPVLDVLESTAQAMFKVTGYVMAFAPIGVFAAIAATVGGKGLAILFTLGKLVALMYLGLAIFALVVVGGVSYLIRVPFFTFLKAIREPFLIAFTTASSEAALPKSLEVMEHFGVPKNIVASFCRPGTASISTAPRSTCRSRASSSRSLPASR